MRQRLLLVCGLASSVVYATMTVLTAGEWNAFGVGSDPYGELPSIASRWMWAVPWRLSPVRGPAAFSMRTEADCGEASRGGARS